MRAMIFCGLMLLSAMGIVTEAAGATDPLQRWIVGSYVNVRSQPARSAEVVEHLTANTPVVLTTQTEDYCEISWGDTKQGFVACNLLADQPLRIEDIQYSYLPGGATMPNNAQLRTFWLEPTVANLFEAGEYFRRIMLPTEQLHVENCFLRLQGVICDTSYVTPNLKRFQIPEFEAMKTLLVNGIIAPHSQFKPIEVWESARTHMPNFEFRPRHNIEMYERIRLPTVSPSFFKSISEIGRPSARTEQLSAQYQIPFRMSVVDKPMLGVSDNGYPSIMGAWDIGAVTLRLDSPIYEVAIDLKGRVAIGTTVAESRRRYSDWRCADTQNYMQGTINRLLPGYRNIKTPLMFFRLATLPVLSKAKVIFKDQYGSTTSHLRGEPTTAHIDLDKDGIDDLLVWDDGGKGEAEYDEHHKLKKIIVNNVDVSFKRIRLIFVNVVGQWYLLDSDDEHAC